MEQNKLSFDKAKEKALRLLEFRSHSEKELKDKLKYAGADEEDIEKILEFCRHYGFVNDRDYALRKARDLKNLKKFGKRRISQELYSKGISSEYIAQALEELDFDDVQDVLLPMVRRKLNGDLERKSIDRCIRYFIYRGYDIGDIKTCIDIIKGESDEL